MEEQLLLHKLTLHVKIDDESQLYSNYSYSGDNLSPELSDYLKEKAEHALPLPPKENFIVQIHTQNNNLRLPDITRCIHRHFHNEYDAEKRKLRNNSRLALVLFTLGMVALVLQFFAEEYVDNFFLTEILNVAAWVFIWGAVEVFVLERYNIRRHCVILRRLAFAEIDITNDSKLDAPVYI